MNVRSSNLAANLATLQAFVLIAFSSWALGGRYPGSPFYIGLIGWCAIIPIIIFWYELEWKGFKKWCLYLTPWFLLSVQMGISWQNPMRTGTSSADSEYTVWTKVEPIEWLPLCFNQERTQDYSFILIGALLTGISVFTVIRKRKQMIRLLMLIAINCLILALVGAWFKLTKNPNVLGQFEPVNPKFFASFRYYNHWVAFALLNLGAAVAVAEFMIQQYNKNGWNERGRQRWDIVWVAIAAIIWICIPLSGSRSGMLFSATFIVGSGIYLSLAYRKKSSIFAHLERRSRKILGISLLAFLGIFSALGFILVKDDIMHRLNLTQKEIAEGRVDQRFYASPRDCWHMIKDRPVWGWGLGSYAHIFFKYAGPEYRHPLGKIIKRNEYAHNDWMQYWVELGTLGYILLLSVPAGIIVKTFRNSRQNSECYWLALSVGLFLTMASFDFPFGPSAGIANFAVIFAASARLSLGAGSKDRYEYD